MSAHISLLDRTPVHPCRPGDEDFDKFACDPPQANPDTPDPLTPDVSLTRKFFDNREVVMPDGARIRVWGFEDPDSDVRGPFPSEIIRVRQGQVVHVTIEAAKNAHTIHHHGIEPTPHNDGVGHTSFEVTGDYTYQWQPRFAGTYLYHCHKNTPLHFAFGMLGFLIVDPPEGPGRAFQGGPAYDVEAMWAFREIDPDWHTRGHDAGMCGEDVGMNVFVPRYFLISGVPQPSGPGAVIGDPRVAIRARLGDRILIRLANAGFANIRLTIAGLDGRVIASDGRPFLPPFARPFPVVAGTSFDDDIYPAERYDMLVEANRRGTHEVTVEYRHWIRRQEVLGTARTTITVT